ncbi:acetolactate synthase, small subunit [Blautia hansenii DSM 20583]|uniref:acetolactate synthase n=2 Tax=Blautia hansenii TaxID=1322 RepID=C9L6F9_BLAHA|nr:acetolactate synthase, small subunit [Blautia hansenii DSM 20583]
MYYILISYSVQIALTKLLIVGRMTEKLAKRQRRRCCMNKRILSILVENTAGVLSRVSGLFSRRGYNIDSLSAGITTDPNYTRMTVVCKGDELILEQITRQVEKLEDVLSVKVLKDDQSVTRELMLVKVRVSPEQRAGITAIVDIFRANIIDVGKESMIVELTGNKSKLEAFIDLLDGYEILEIARTGIAGLSRGSDDIFYLSEDEEEF